MPDRISLDISEGVAFATVDSPPINLLDAEVLGALAGVTERVANDDDGTGTTNAQSSNDASFALVVGVTGAPRADDADGGNHFSQSFRRAAETARARFKHDAFEASVVQVARQNLGEFMEALSDIDAERVARERMHAAA